MMNLPIPTVSHQLVFELSREKFTDEQYQARLVEGQSKVLLLGQEYLALGNSGELHSLEKDSAVPPDIQSGDMQKLYREGLLRKNTEARRIYDKLKLSSPFRVCPFCLHRSVKTLDHYLPKAEYGAYAVLPTNLLPACRDCNSEKDRFSAVDRAASLIHPYFDHIDSKYWLGCEIRKRDGYCTPEFYIDSTGVDVELLARLISHMEVLDLFDLYDVEGAREVNDMVGTLGDTFEESGASGVSKLCKSMGSSRTALAQNYWRAVLWRTAAEDEEFCSLKWV